MSKHETYIDKNKWKKERLKTIAKKAIILVLLIFASNFIIDKVFHYNFLSNTLQAIVGLANQREDVPSIDIVSSGWENQADGAWRVTKTSKWDDESNADITIDVESIAKISNKKKDIVLVLDNSYSMKGTKLDNLKTNTIDLITTLLDETENTIALINFNRNSTILSDFTNDKNKLIESVNNLQSTGTTNYNAALKNVDIILQDYEHKGDKDLIVLFLSDGYPCEDTPNQIPTFQMLKEKYKYLTINAVQYEMGDKIQPDLIEISDKQYLATEENLGTILYKAISSSEFFEEFKITDVINGKDFFIDSESDIKVTLGTFKLVKEDGVQKVLWDLGANSYRTGTTERMTIHLTMVREELETAPVESHTSFGAWIGKSYMTNTSAEVISKFNGEVEEDVKTDKTPILPATYWVFYVEEYDSEGYAIEHYVGDIVTIDSYSEHSSGNSKYARYVIQTDGVKKINDREFVMPPENVILRETRISTSVSKRMDGSVFSYAGADKQLYNLVKRLALSSNRALKYNGEGSNDFANDVYYFTDAASNNDPNTSNFAYFANFCWQIVRTTETGGTKLVFYGEKDEEGKCSTTSKASLSGEYNYNYRDLSSVGYTQSNIDYASFEKISFTESKGLYIKDVYIREQEIYENNEREPRDYYYSKTINYNQETGEYELVDPEKVNCEKLKDQKDYYICNEGYTSCKSIYYVVYSKYYSSINAEVLALSNGESLDDVNNIVVGTGYEKTPEGVYKLLNQQTIKKSEWRENYKSYPNFYTCANDDCTSLSYILGYNEDGFITYSDTYFDYEFGDSFTYDNSSGIYTLNDTKTFMELEGDLSSNHYMCLSKHSTYNPQDCTTMQFLVHKSSNNYFYANLQNGKDINDYINESLIPDDNDFTDSNAKTLLETWYETYLLNDYNDYIEDTVYCNDRGIADLGGWNPNGGKLEDDLRFATYERTPTLVCKSEKDSYSLSNSKAKLKYPIGLLTYDEITLSERLIYVDTMSPRYVSFDSNRIYNTLYMSNYSTGGSYSIGDSRSLDPVISLKPGTRYTTGDGSAANPYVIE